MFVGWIVTYQSTARVISLPKVYLSHFRTCSHVLLLLQWIPQYRPFPTLRHHRFKDHSYWRLGEPRDRSMNCACARVDITTGDCFCFHHCATLFCLHERLSMSSYCPVLWSKLRRKVGWATALPWLAFKHFFIPGLLYSLCSVSSFISQRNAVAVCKSLMYIMRLCAIQREFCNN